MDAGIVGSGNIGATPAPCLEFSAYLSRLGRADERTRTADLISLRVRIHALQGLAQACKPRIDKPVSLPWLARCCTVLRSRWCQSGVRCPAITSCQSLCKPDKRLGYLRLAQCAGRDTIFSGRHESCFGYRWCRASQPSELRNFLGAFITRLARVSCAPHPPHRKRLGRPSAPGSYQSRSRPRKRMISPHPPHASARRPHTSSLVIPMTFPSGAFAPCPKPNPHRVSGQGQAA
jgi:hypothetical protein